MTKTDTIPILYSGGSYGTFVEWCLNYFSGRSPSKLLPFNKNGNSHLFSGNYLNGITGWREYIASDKKYQFVRFHPKLSSKESVIVNLTEVANSSKKVIFLHMPDDLILLGINNKFEKIFSEGWLEHNKEMFKDNLLKWSSKNLSEMAIWEIREFLSFYIISQHKSESEIDDITSINLPNVLIISVKDLINDFESTIKKIFHYCDLPIVETNFQDIYNSWISLQKHKDKDVIVSKIVQSVLENEQYDWKHHQLTIADEAVVQYRLRDLHNLELKCYNLNYFPTNTLTLKELLFHV